MKTVYSGTPILGEEYPFVAFTSENGARAASRIWSGPKGTAYCVGDRTAQVAEEFGWKSISANGTGRDLAEMIAQANHSGVVLWPCGDQVRDEFIKTADRLGIKIKQLPVYHMGPTQNGPNIRAFVQASRLTIIPVFSPKGSESAFKWIADLGDKLHVVAISHAAATCFDGICPVTIAEAPNGTAMIRAIASIYPSVAP